MSLKANFVLTDMHKLSTVPSGEGNYNDIQLPFVVIKVKKHCTYIEKVYHNISKRRYSIKYYIRLLYTYAIEQDIPLAQSQYTEK